MDTKAKPKRAGVRGTGMIDARNKIIQRNRLKIRDARDKLAQITKRSGDARIKLMKKMHTRGKVQAHGTRRPFLPQPQPPKKNRRPTYAVDRRPPAFVNNQHLMDMDADYVPASISLRRTVQNEIAYSKMPPLPSFQRPSSDSIGSYHHMLPSQPPQPSAWNSDPFDCYEVPIGRPSDVSEPKNLHRQIRNIGAEMMPRKGILR